MERDRRDSIDLGTMNITQLFNKLFFPTLIGMVLTATITITDGIFVGRGIGSDGLAAINIAAPLFMITTGLALMFGVGASVVASIHLSQGRTKAANINITQAFIVASLTMMLITVLVMFFCTQTALIFGSTPRLLPLVKDYIYFIAPSFVFLLLESIGLFIIRLDGSPNYAMMCSAIAAVLNIILDYVFIFPLQGGLIGAALASSVSITVGGILVLLYMFRYSKTLKFYRLKMSIKSLRLTVRNIGSQIKVGSSALLGEVAIAMMILIGNYVFINMLGEEGVAAFSVACYCYPIVFMINNAVAQSAQPIISYNYGNGNYLRVKHAFTLSLRVALIGGILTSVVMIFFSRYVIAMFLDPHCEAYLIAIKGMPCFALGFMFFAFNIVCIGYYQSIERSKIAMMFAILRGFLFLAMTFWLLPKMWGNIGIWLSVPFAEILTAMIVGMVYLKHRLSAFKFSANPT